MIEENQEAQLNNEMTAGEMLRAARTTGRRKREIATIAKQLCIREDFLQALEDGNYTVLPEIVYILGFARNYAMELGIDPDVIVKKIKKEMGIDFNDEVIQGVVELPEREKPKVKETFDKNFQKFKDTKFCKFLVKYWKWILGGVVVFAIIGIIIGMIIAPAAEETAPVEEVAPVVNAEPAYRQTVHERYGMENREDGEIVIQAAEESWVKIEDARGKTVFSRVLVPGDLYYVPKGNKNKATFGNVGGIDIWVRGELAPKVGKDHSRKTGILLDADALLGINKSAEKAKVADVKPKETKAADAKDSKTTDTKNSVDKNTTEKKQ
ncbi:MAG: helix-turn-helix domain-containing protein [Alphaproteobacteria bacterium]|nr:helix-turn-helix domain-containing protein [Alphaproteobacteria bacterium]